MSRVGKMPIAIPSGVEIAVSETEISVKGPMGTLVRPANALVSVKSENLAVSAG